MTGFLKTTAVLSLMAGLSFFAWEYRWLLLGRSDTLNGVIVEGNEVLTKGQIVRTAGLRPGQSLASVDADRVESLLRMHPRVGAARVSIRPDGRLVIELEEKRALAIIRSRGKVWEVNGRLEILSQGQPLETDLLVISVRGGRRERDKVVVPQDSFLPEAMKRLDDVFSRYPVVRSWISEFSVDGQGKIRASLVNRRLIVDFGLTIDSDKVRRLYAALSHFEQEKIYPAYLDLTGVDAVYR